MILKKKTINKIRRQHHLLDAKGEIAGRLASKIAFILIGKHKVGFKPQLDFGDYVQVENVSQLKFSGKKLEQKFYYHASGYPGGLKKVLLNSLFKEKPETVLRLMVLRMLPKNKLRAEMINRLTFKSEK